MSDKSVSQERENLQDNQNKPQRNRNDAARESDVEKSDEKDRTQNISENQTERPYTDGRTIAQATDPDKLSDI